MSGLGMTKRSLLREIQINFPTSAAVARYYNPQTTGDMFITRVWYTLRHLAFNDIHRLMSLSVDKLYTLVGLMSYGVRYFNSPAMHQWWIASDLTLRSERSCRAGFNTLMANTPLKDYAKGRHPFSGRSMEEWGRVLRGIADDCAPTDYSSDMQHLKVSMDSLNAVSYMRARQGGNQSPHTAKLHKRIHWTTIAKMRTGASVGGERTDYLIALLHWHLWQPHVEVAEAVERWVREDLGGQRMKELMWVYGPDNRYYTFTDGYVDTRWGHATANVRDTVVTSRESGPRICEDVLRWFKPGFQNHTYGGGVVTPQINLVGMRERPVVTSVEVLKGFDLEHARQTLRSLQQQPDDKPKGEDNSMVNTTLSIERATGTIDPAEHKD